MAKKATPKSNPTKPGTTFTKKVTKGPNKGDTVSFKVAPGGKPYPTAVQKDVGKKNTSNIAKQQRKKNK